MRKEFVCPVCKGTGYLPKPSHNHDLVDMKKRAVKALLKVGYSYRQIMSMLGYKSTRTIVLYSK